MSRVIFLCGAALAILATGCKNNASLSAGPAEQPYTPEYQSLDTMDNATSADSATVSDTDRAASATTAYAGDTSADESAAPLIGNTYTVAKGDTLYRLARRFYSDQGRWREIWNANRTRVPNPDVLSIGTKLIIP